MIETNKTFKWKYGLFKALGVWFSASDEVMFQLNFKPKLNAIQYIINVWSGLKGKVTIMYRKVLLVKLTECFFSFLWGQNKRPKVKHKLCKLLSPRRI